MEAIERYSGIFQGDEIKVRRRFTDFPAGDAIPPNDVMLFSDAQLRRDQTSMFAQDVTPTSAPFDPSAEVEWSPVWSLRDGRFKYLPTSLLYFFYRSDSGCGEIHADSNGCAAGNTLEEAIVQGFLELVERKFLRNLVVQSIAAGGSGPRPVRGFLCPRSANPACRNGTPALGARHYQRSRHSKFCGDVARGGKRAGFRQYGSGSHFNRRMASARALTELNQFLSIGLMGGRDAGASSNDNSGPFRLQDHPYLMPNGGPARLNFCADFGRFERANRSWPA